MIDDVRRFIGTPFGGIVFLGILVAYPILLVIGLAWLIGKCILNWMSRWF